MDQELIEAQARLLKKREEEKMTVQEDIGYQKNTSRNLSPLFPTRIGSEILNVSKPLPADRIRVEYINGVLRGLTHILRSDIANDLIRRGYAREVK